jgi:hypothetical protein
MIVLAAALSLGSEIHYNRRPLVPGPWALVAHVPVLDALIVSRLTFLALPFLGLLVALILARVTAGTAEAPAPPRRVRRYALLAVVAALVPLAPTPLAVTNRPPIPKFITSGDWQQSIPPGSTLMTVPMTMSNGGLDTINWQVPADGQFNLVGGYFLQPHGADKLGHYFPAYTPTQRMLNDLWLTGKAPKVTETQRAQARTDLAALRVDDIVVADRGHTTEVLNTLTQLLGMGPVHRDDVWTWKIRGGIAIQAAG